jgi:glutamine---fructose-6-phosphate transaminase (isomerizing)
LHLKKSKRLSKNRRANCMCGIVGYIGPRDALKVVMAGLKKLEYRGYDSAGIAQIVEKELVVHKASGKLGVLKDRLALIPSQVASTTAIGHTRWATHGEPNQANAHPHISGHIALIHNGIIENYGVLRERLVAEGTVFLSQTDSEVAAHMLAAELEICTEELNASLEALERVCKKLHGSYAIIAIDERRPDSLLVAKTATPIVIGICENEVLIASDIPALLDYTNQIVVLEDGDTCEVTVGRLTIKNKGCLVNREVQTVAWNPVVAQKGGHKHFLLKEIYDQVTVVSDALRGRIDRVGGNVIFENLYPFRKRTEAVKSVTLLGCGTAWHACLAAKYFIEAIAEIHCNVDYASEFRYRDSIVGPDSLVIGMSQSGETADTIAAFDKARSTGALSVAICNVLGSTLTRRSNVTLFTQAGPEISVASTKAFTNQLVICYLLAVYLGVERKTISASQSRVFVDDILRLPSAIEKVLKLALDIKKIAKLFCNAKNFLFLGRGSCFPMALEGALKLKEISYIHAEGYPAGEIKHGPLALVDENMPVLVLLQKSDELFSKTVSSLREVHARKGRIIAFTDSDREAELAPFCEAVITAPYVSSLLSPIVLNVLQQLLAYDIAAINGTDVDQPRNLAKSVTVE